MNIKEIQALAKAAAKHLKTEQDLNELRKGKIKAMPPQVKLTNQATHSVIPAI